MNKKEVLEALKDIYLAIPAWNEYDRNQVINVENWVKEREQ